MLTAFLSFVVLILPQSQSRPSSSEIPPQARAIGVDENGWPIFAQGKTQARPGVSGRSDFETQPRPIQAGQIAGADSAGPVVTDEDSEAADPMRLGSPLREVFTRQGYPSDMRELGGVLAWYRFTLRGHNGAVIGSREVEHHADMRRADRDLLKMSSGQKTYGRDGASVFAYLDRMRMESYEDEARDELELLGLLLRFPWGFADGERYVVGEKQYLTVAGQAMVLIPIRAKRSIDASLPGASVDRFEILCAADSMEPRELRYTLAATGQSRRLRFSEYRQVGGVRIPFRREFLDGVGSPSLILEILSMDHGRDVSAVDFRPLQ